MSTIFRKFWYDELNKNGTKYINYILYSEYWAPKYRHSCFHIWEHQGRFFGPNSTHEYDIINNPFRYELEYAHHYNFKKEVWADVYSSLFDTIYL